MRSGVASSSAPPPRRLRHDAKDGVVAADAGSDLLVVFLGVTHLVELGLTEQTGGRSEPSNNVLPVSGGILRGYSRWTPTWILRTRRRSAACGA